MIVIVITIGFLTSYLYFHFDSLHVLPLICLSVSVFLSLFLFGKGEAAMECGLIFLFLQNWGGGKRLRLLPIRMGLGFRACGYYFAKLPFQARQRPAESKRILRRNMMASGMR